MLSFWHQPGEFFLRRLMPTATASPPNPKKPALIIPALFPAASADAPVPTWLSALIRSSKVIFGLMSTSRASARYRSADSKNLTARVVVYAPRRTRSPPTTINTTPAQPDFELFAVVVFGRNFELPIINTLPDHQLFLHIGFEERGSSDLGGHPSTVIRQAGRGPVDHRPLKSIPTSLPRGRLRDRRRRILDGAGVVSRAGSATAASSTVSSTGARPERARWSKSRSEPGRGGGRLAPLLSSIGVVGSAFP